MPNWCSNKATLTGPRSTIEELTRAATYTDEHGNQEIRFAELIQMPKILEDTMSPTPEEEFPEATYRGWVDDPTNEHWTEDTLAEARIRHDEARAKAVAAFAETGFYNWYDWQHSTYGIKWGDSDGEIINETFTDSDETHITLSVGYSTPWGPFDDMFWEKITAAYRDVHIEVIYEEPGMCFSGGNRYLNGETIAAAYDNWIDHPDLDWDSDPDAAYDQQAEWRGEVLDRIERELYGLEVSA